MTFRKTKTKRSAKRKAWEKAYRNSVRGRAYMKNWREQNPERVQAYRSSPKARASYKAWMSSGRGKTVRKKYNRKYAKTVAGQKARSVAARRYSESPWGRATGSAAHKRLYEMTYKEVRKALIAAGKCPICTKTNKSGVPTRCDACALAIIKRRLARVNSGICIRCKLPAVAGQCCLHHWFCSITKNHFNLTLKNGGVDMAKKLWEQQKGLCALTGDVLVPGFNASLDHILARSKGGLTTEKNLQWVLLDVNSAKRSLRVDEFIALCKKVVAYSEKQKNIVMEKAN